MSGYTKERINVLLPEELWAVSFRTGDGKMESYLYNNLDDAEEHRRLMEEYEAYNIKITKVY